MDSLIDNVTAKLAAVVDSLPHIAQRVRDGIPWALANITAAQVVSVLAVGLFTTMIYRRYLNPVADIPGPFVATLTRLWHMYHILKGDQNLQLVALHQKLGHFVRVSHNEVSVSHPEGLRQVLLKALDKGPWYKATAIPDYRFQKPMSLLSVKEKNERSRHFASAYTASNVLRSEEAINGPMVSLVTWMDRFAESGKPMDLDKFFTYTAFDVVGEAVFSKQFGFSSQGLDIGGSIRNALAVGAYVSVGGFFHWLYTIIIGNPIVTDLGILPLGHLYNTTMKAINEREGNQDARYDMLAHWNKALKESKGALKPVDVHAQAVTVVSAGSDTVSASIQSFVYHSIRHPTAWARMRAEIKAAQARGLCQDRIIAFSDTQQLLFLEACIKEAFRVFGPVPMGLQRRTPPQGLHIGDRRIPGNTLVSINPWVMHYSKEIWGSDADQYNPDRWLIDPDIASKEKYLIPFGAGYASCPGQHLAKMEVAKMAATVVRDYNLKLVDETKKWKWRAYFTIVPSGWPVYVEKVGG